MLTESEIKAYTVDIPNDIQAAQRASGCASATLLDVPNGDFQKLVEEMSESELRVRVLNQWSFIAAYAKSLDGLNLKTPGSIDGHRMPEDIRRAVETLIGTSNDQAQRLADASQSATKKEKP